MVAWWLMPAIMLGTSLYAKARMKAGKFRWIPKTEAEVKKLPVGYVMATMVETGDELPVPPAGHGWKEIKMLMATTPLTPPEEIVMHVMEPMFANAQAIGGFLTSQQITDPTGLGSTYPTTQEIAVAPRLSNFLTREYYATAPQLDGFEGLGSLCGWPDGLLEAMTSLRQTMDQAEPDLRARGLQWDDVRPNEVRAGDFMVMRDG